MKNSIEQISVSINSIKIGNSTLKKSHLEQMPYIKESDFRSELSKGNNDLSVFCSFPYQVLNDIVFKINKKLGMNDQISVTSCLPRERFLTVNVDSNSYEEWDDTLGLVLYSAKRKSFFLSSYHKELSSSLRKTENSNIYNREYKIEKLNNFINAPDKDDLEDIIKEFKMEIDLISEFEENYNDLENDFKLFFFSRDMDKGRFSLVNSRLVQSLEYKRKHKEAIDNIQEYDFSKLISHFVNVVFKEELSDLKKELEDLNENKKRINLDIDNQDKLIEESAYIAFL